MKKRVIAIGIGLYVFITFATAQATLLYNSIDNSVPEGVVYDDQAGLYWYQDLSAFINQTYDQQMSSVAGLGGDWTMAKYDQMAALWSYSAKDIATAFTSTVTGSLKLWLGRYDEGTSPDMRYYVQAAYNSSSGNYTKMQLNVYDMPIQFKNYDLGAWVVSTGDLGDLAPVPEPATMFLIGTGIAGLAGIRSRRKQK